MRYAAVTGWGQCMPPAVLGNADLATFLDTDDAWIASRTGIRERRVSHVPGMTLAHVAARAHRQELGHPVARFQHRPIEQNARGAPVAVAERVVITDLKVNGDGAHDRMQKFIGADLVGKVAQPLQTGGQLSRWRRRVQEVRRKSTLPQRPTAWRKRPRP